ncbi:unnamed protein product [Blepharisma stoltei]|uniref:Uncharacterized protein n=1 Tax=Blepharisma stoltei TaxID=1481888 RepID=A0AAU9JHH5_9CILI|nr:unnamed protein product [Blepharisma stoltei]
MSKKEAREIPWNQVKIPILILLSTSINTAFTIPISGFFVLETKSVDSLQDIGYYSGLLTFAFCLGKFISWRFISWASLQCGHRFLASLLLFFSVFLTMLFGLCTSLISGIAIRFFAGICSVPQLISKILLRQLSQPCMEKFYQVTYVAVIVQTIGFGIGIIIGGTTSYIKINEGAQIGDFINTHPFLIPSFIIGLVQFFTFIWVLSQIADNPAPISQPKSKPKPTTKPIKDQVKPGKYIELEETKKNEEGKDEGPITERKENQSEEDEEELPSYLQASGMDLILADSEEPKTSSRNEIQYFSPRYPVKNIDYKKWPMSARGEVGKVFHIDNEGEEELARESDEPENSEPERAGNIQNVKHTHISFVEEDFDEPTEGDLQPPAQNFILEDPFKRNYKHFYEEKAVIYALVHLAIFSLCFASIEEFFIAWFMIQFDMKNIEIAVILSVSYLFGYALHIYIMPKLLDSVPLWKTIRIVSYMLIGLSMFFVPINYFTEPILIFMMLVAVITLFKFSSCILLTSSRLFISDSVNIHDRESLEVYADELELAFKIFGSFVGPLLLSAFAGMPIPLTIVLCAFLILISWLLTLLSFNHFPRFNVYPYRV